MEKQVRLTFEKRLTNVLVGPIVIVGATGRGFPIVENHLIINA